MERGCCGPQGGRHRASYCHVSDLALTSGKWHTAAAVLGMRVCDRVGDTAFACRRNYVIWEDQVKGGKQEQENTFATKTRITVELLFTRSINEFLSYPIILF